MSFHVYSMLLVVYCLSMDQVPVEVSLFYDGFRELVIKPWICSSNTCFHVYIKKTEKNMSRCSHGNAHVTVFHWCLLTNELGAL